LNDSAESPESGPSRTRSGSTRRSKTDSGLRVKPAASRRLGEATGGHRQPPGGSESLRKILTIPRKGGEPVPPCPNRAQPLRAQSRAGNAPIPSGNAPIPSCNALIPSCTRRPWPPERPSHPPEATGGDPIPPSQFHRSQPLQARSRAGKALFRRATPLFRRATCRPWPTERPSHPPEANGSLPAARSAIVKF